MSNDARKLDLAYMGVLEVIRAHGLSRVETLWVLECMKHLVLREVFDEHIEEEGSAPAFDAPGVS